MDNLTHAKFDTILMKADGTEFSVANTVITNGHGQSVVVAQTDPQNQGALHENVAVNQREVQKEFKEIKGEALDVKNMRYLEKIGDSAYNQRNLEQGPNSPSDNQVVGQEELANHLRGMDKGPTLSPPSQDSPLAEAKMPTEHRQQYLQQLGPEPGGR